MSIKKKILLSFLFPLILISSVSIYGYHYYGNIILKEKSYETLDNISKNKKELVDVFLANQKLIINTLREI